MDSVTFFDARGSSGTQIASGSSRKLYSFAFITRNLPTRHVTVIIRVVEDDQCNMFKTLSPADTSKMWKLVIELILCTDMAKHFAFVKKVEELSHVLFR